MRFFAVLSAVLLSIGTAHASDPDALWKIVHERCVPGEIQHHDPKPCVAVDLSGGEAKGYAVLKDIHGLAQHLLLPTAKITGIESPALLEPGSPNYWQAAWDARRFMPPIHGKPIPDDDLALAINSEHGRSQNQLHIHIDCIRPEVKQVVLDHLSQISAAWSVFPVTLAGHNYRAMRLDAGDLKTHDLFALLAATDAAAKNDMADQTLAALRLPPDAGPAGFVVLNDHASLAAMDSASSEQLLDHDCAVVP